MASKSDSKESLFVSSAQMAEADKYNEWTFSLFEQYIKGEVLEVGCGIGSFTHRILHHDGFERLLSIDISHDAVDYCRAKFFSPKLSFQCVDVRKVQGQFDLIICMNVLEHIEDHGGSLAHLFEMLKSGGVLFLLVPAHQTLYNQFDVEAGHFRRYNKKSVRDVLVKSADGKNYQLDQFYFNSIGALGYWFVYKALGKKPQGNAAGEIGLFDKVVVPVMRRIEGRVMPFGISVISIITKG